MKKLISLLAFALVAFPTFAQGLHKDIKPGMYSATTFYYSPAFEQGQISRYGMDYGYYYSGNDNKFRVSIRGSQFVLTDPNTGIRYRLDLGNSGEQSLPKDYLRFLKEKSRVKALGSMVEDITVSGLKPAGIPGSDEMTGHLNFYVSLPIKGSTLKAKIAVPGKVLSRERTFRRYRNSPPYGEFEVTMRPVFFTMTGNPRIEYVRSAYPEADGVLAKILTWLLSIGAYESTRGAMLMPEIAND